MKAIINKIDPRTTGGRWKRVRNIAGIVAGGLGLIILAPINLPADIALWIQWGAAVSGFIATGANFDSSDKEKKGLKILKSKK